MLPRLVGCSSSKSKTADGRRNAAGPMLPRLVGYSFSKSKMGSRVCNVVSVGALCFVIMSPEQAIARLGVTENQIQPMIIRPAPPPS